MTYIDSKFGIPSVSHGPAAELNYTEILIRQRCDELADTLIRKRRDYGARNFDKRGIPGIIVRIEDKLSRLEQLQTKAPEVEESLKDTSQDGAGYFIIAGLFAEGKW